MATVKNEHLSLTYDLQDAVFGQSPISLISLTHATYLNLIADQVFPSW